MIGLGKWGEREVVDFHLSRFACYLIAHDQETAIATHEQVGKEVRAAIERIGGTPPERLAAAEHIQVVERRLKAKAARALEKGSTEGEEGS